MATECSSGFSLRAKNKQKQPEINNNLYEQNCCRKLDDCAEEHGNMKSWLSYHVRSLYTCVLLITDPT